MITGKKEKKIPKKNHLNNLILYVRSLYISSVTIFVDDCCVPCSTTICLLKNENKDIPSIFSRKHYIPKFSTLQQNSLSISLLILTCAEDRTGTNDRGGSCPSSYREILPSQKDILNSENTRKERLESPINIAKWAKMAV